VFALVCVCLLAVQVSAEAMRPGDILTASNKKTIEVTMNQRGSHTLNQRHTHTSAQMHHLCA